MQIFDSLDNLPESARGAVVAIGNFDGVHKGHLAVLARASAIARAENLKLAVLTFEPHPRALFRPDDPPGRLTPRALKAARLAEAGVDVLYIATFDWEFASRPAEEFIAGTLIKNLAAAHIVVGADFRFGQMRKGRPADIERAGIPVTTIEAFTDAHGIVCSSSHIREALGQGRVADANLMLGWDWEIRGPVRPGDRRGRGLGYPTANMALGGTIHPAYGVYAARVNIEGEAGWHGAAINIGIRPMFETHEAAVESYIFDFSGDLYRKTLRVQPVKRLRPEAKFGTLDELTRQMDEDCRKAREILFLSLLEEGNEA